MIINIKAFGIAREIFGSTVVSISLPDTAVVADLLPEIKRLYPAMNKLSSFAIAVNGCYATNETALTAADEVAVIPPVSGG
jgi:molybdopterin synthase sulfur carrier subunit